MNTPMIELPDGSGCFTATIMSQDEAMALPLKQRPLNHRISGDIYHAVFEAIGEASTTWKTEMGNEVFNSAAAEKIAVNLCFKIANEAEKWRELSATEVCAGNPAIAEYVASLESRLAQSKKLYDLTLGNQMDWMRKWKEKSDEVAELHAKDSVRTREYNTLVQENRALHAALSASENARISDRD